MQFSRYTRMRAQQKWCCVESLLSYTVFIFDALARSAMSDKTEGLRASHSLIWLIVYQSSEFKISFGLWSLVNPAFSQHCPADGVGPTDCCPPIPVFIFNFGSGSAFVFSFLNWRPPTLPHRLQCSTIGRSGLNHRVRDGNGCCPWAHRHQ